MLYVGIAVTFIVGFAWWTTTSGATMPAALDATAGRFYSKDEVDERIKAAIAAFQKTDPRTGKAVALPSVRLTDDEEEKMKSKREDGSGKAIYGGVGDKPHLGGFTAFDSMGVSRPLWKLMVEDFNVHSLIDVGCGKGVSTLWFHLHGVDVHCVEGSHDAVTQSNLPAERVTEHDFLRGPWWPEKTYDVAWSVELLEHIGRQHSKNYFPIFDKSAMLIVTSSTWGGWHHVEVHEGDWWWIARFEARGFVFSRTLTELIRAKAKLDPVHTSSGQHLWTRGLVFLNPKVASLPAHDHLFGGHSCWVGKAKTASGVGACTAEDYTEADVLKGVFKNVVPIVDKPNADWEKAVFPPDFTPEGVYDPSSP